MFCMTSLWESGLFKTELVIVVVLIVFCSFEVMSVCWELQPEDRPTFADCVAMIEALLQDRDPIEVLENRRSKPADDPPAAQAPPVPSEPPSGASNMGNG